MNPLGARGLASSGLICLLLLAVPGDRTSSAATYVATEDLVLACVGDVMLGRGVAETLAGDWSAAFAQVRPWLAQADLVFGNLESPLTTVPQLRPGYDLRAPPDAVDALSAGSFDVVSLANNHALDAGRAGLVETISTLNGSGIRHLLPAGYDQPVGFHTVFVALDDSSGGLDLRAASEAVAEAAGRAELVVVSVHWGGEYQAIPSERQRTVAGVLADSGADVVIGHGPHVLQSLEWHGEALVAYSLGNFIFDQPYPVDLRWGVILRVHARAGRAVAVDVLPTVAERGRVRPAGAAEGAVILRRMALATGIDS